MKTKQIIKIIIILIIGIVIGKFAFTNNNSNNIMNHSSTEKKEEHWTCSMHPEIDLPEFGSCPKCGMDLILREENNEGLSSNKFKMSKNAMALANVETITIGNIDAINNVSTNNVLTLSGKIATNEKTTSMQTAHFGGRIEHLYYRSVGEYVKKGGLIASIYSPELVTAQNEFIEALTIKNEQPELYKAVRNKLKNWKISEKQIQKIEHTNRVITNFNMYANVAGYIDEILIQEGNHINEGTPLFKVSNLASVWAVFDVYEQDIKQLKIGQKVMVKLNAYPEKEIMVKINFIDPNLNVATRTVQVRATLVNTKSKLKPGMILIGEVQLAEKSIVSSTIEIPKTAILWTGKRSIVYVKTGNDNSIFELREIELGTETVKGFQVLSGLEDGEEVVVNGTFTVDAAAQLQGKSSMMNVSKITKKEHNNTVKKLTVDLKFEKQLTEVFKDYMFLKDAFVLTDVLAVKEKANKTLIELKKVNMKLLKNKEAHKIWMKEMPIIKMNLIAIDKELTIEKQREYFINLSNAMIVIVNSFGIKSTVYVQHCPMANNNNGADWLSFQKEIKNPYFGNKMLHCGSVKQEINKSSEILESN